VDARDRRGHDEPESQQLSSMTVQQA